MHKKGINVICADERERRGRLPQTETMFLRKGEL
jgi:hypothetical protein